MRLKKWVKIAIAIIILSILIIPFTLPKKEEKKETEIEKEEVKEEIKITEVIYDKLKDHNIDKDFIIYIDNNYKGSLEKLNSILEKEEYDTKLWHKVTGYSYLVLNDLYNKKYDSMDNIKIIESNNPSKISIVGDVSLADNWYIMPKYDSRKKKVYGILSEDVVKEMTSSDVMIANNEFTISHRGTAMAGKQYTFRAKKERLSIYNEMGVDMVTLANNHVYDFGKDAFLDMLNALDEYKMPRIGAGRNFEEARKPYYFIINGYKFAFVNATRAEKYILTPEAKKSSPGVFRCYDTTNMVKLIKEVKGQSDYVIAIIHFGKEGYHELEKEQIRSAKEYLDSGADIVVGHHAHALQGIEFYKNKPIIYNLGDFIFNARDEETAMFQIHLDDAGNMEYYILPALQSNCYTNFLKGKEKQNLINKLISWSINANIDSNGKITEKK
jgi:poly-gamma-glutamate synthesis protein (capsule biosynthesis protein)